MVSDLTGKNTSQWYSCSKRMTAHDQQKKDKVIIQNKIHLSDEEQSNLQANHFSNIPNEYIKLKNSDVKIPKFPRRDIFQIKNSSLEYHLPPKTTKSTVQGDIPAKVYKEMAANIVEPITHMFNASLIQIEYPVI